MPNVSESYDRSPSPRTYSTGSTAILESGSKVLLLVSRTSTQNGVCRVGNGSSLASCPTPPHLHICSDAQRGSAEEEAEVEGMAGLA